MGDAVTSTGMKQAMDTLNSGLTADALWASVQTVMPFIITVTLFSFGFWLAKKILKKVRTGKAI